MAGLVLEGIVGSGKTSVMHYVRKYFVEQNCSTLILTEDDTEGPMEPFRSSSPLESISHLNRLLSIIETIHAIQKPTHAKPLHELFFVFERFHLSHCVDIAGLENFHLYSDIDRRLNTFCAKLVVLSVPESDIKERSVVTTKQHRHEKWGRYLNQIAPTDEGVARHYLAQQENLLTLCQKSGIPSMVVDTADRDWLDISNHIIDFVNKK
ncbi:hypothetical protein JNM05_08215 [bacterium]|nr:hypothetical protein [bacterium]